jgi:hypothetical protein
MRLLLLQEQRAAALLLLLPLHLRVRALLLAC